MVGGAVEEGGDVADAGAGALDLDVVNHAAGTDDVDAGEANGAIVGGVGDPDDVVAVSDVGEADDLGVDEDGVGDASAVAVDALNGERVTDGVGRDPPARDGL